MRRSSGFTLVELMAVVTIIAVMAVLAVVSFRKSRTENDVDAFANALRTSIIQARRRAVATRGLNPYGYLLDVHQGSVRWCQIDPTTVDATNLTTTQVDCLKQNPLYERGPLVLAGSDAQLSWFAVKADLVQPGVAYVAAPRLAMPTATGQPLYFGPNGTCDAVFKNALSPVITTPGGFTYYLQPRSTGPDAGFKRRKITIYGISARPRIIDTW
jgi:prepilin-type N-terminal cleavage/methylation domain-containing protein